MGNPGADLRTLPEKGAEPAAQVSSSPLVAASGARHTAILGGPPPPGAAETSIRPETPFTLSGAPASLTIEQMPLPAFINTVFGDTLHLSFEVDPRIAQRNDLITLRTGRPLSPSELLALTRTVLRDYGIDVIFSGNLARVVPNEALMSQSPSVIRGRSTADVAENMRPIFQYVSLRGVSAGDMAGWLQAALGNKLHISTSPQANAVLILGLPEDIQAANEVIATLDQPRLAGHRSLRIEPVFWSAAQLSEKLIDILRAEGYFVGPSLQNPGAVVVLPLRPSNTLVVFASDQKTLTHVEAWARDLDHASQVDPQRSLFFYRVRNTTAESLAAVLNSVLQGKYAAAAAAAPVEEKGLAPGQPLPASRAPRHPSGGCRWTFSGNPAVGANRDRPGA